MKKYVMSLLFAAGAVYAHAQFNAEKDPYLVQSLSSDHIKDVKVETSGGSITVASVNAGEEKIEIYVRPSNWTGSISSLSKDEIKQRLEELYIMSVSTDNGKLTAIAKNKNWDMNWKKSLSISFKIYVAKDVSTDLKTSGGSINLANLRGNQKFATSGGSLTIDGLSGNIDGNTSGGSIKVYNSSDNIDLSTSGGSIEAKNCKGEMKLSTSGGSLKLLDLDGKISANTSGGSINGSNIHGELNTGTSGGSVRLEGIYGSVDASTSGGSVSVSVVELGSYVRVSNSGGNITLDLPQGKGISLDVRGNRVSYNNLNNFSGETASEDHIKGSLNGGGTEVKVRAGSGKVTLNFR